jgi:hypothetical protein
MTQVTKINGIPVVDTKVTGFTYDNVNTFTITQNDGSSYNATINTLSGVSFTNLSATTINPVDYIQFNTNYTGGTVTEGRIYWDPENETLTLGHSGGNVAQQIGQETYYLIKNQSGATIENGRVVRAVGTLGASGRILGEYMIADGTIPPKFTLGLATEDIINGDDGFVTEFGLVRGFVRHGMMGMFFGFHQQYLVG